MLKNSVKFILCLSLLLGGTAYGNKVQEVTDLSDDKKLAQSKNKAILLMFGASDCPYCIVMEEDFLEPMLINEEETAAIIRKVEIDNPDEIIDFDGKPVRISSFANKHRIRVTPTLLFFGHDGKEKAGRIIGIMTVDYLGLYIDTRIELTNRRMQRPEQLSRIAAESKILDREK